MPSAEETTYLFEVMPDAGISQDNFAGRDVDVLVSRIKRNLRLSSLKSRSRLAAHTMRASPYRLHQRDPQQPDQHTTSTATTTVAAAASRRRRRTTAAAFNRRCVKAALVRSELDDSYECFQALLRKGALIKEAVKRLQTSPEEDFEDEMPRDEPVDEDEELEEDEDIEDEIEELVDRKRRVTSTTLDSMDDDDEEG